MKKIAFVLTPLISMSFLVNCSSQTQPKTYVVTFDSNGGTPVSSQTIEENKCATEPAKPTHPDDESYTYVFNEWQLLGHKFDFTTPIIENITLKANWYAVSKYTLTVTSEDTSKGTVKGSGSYPSGSSVTISATPSSGYAFEGWYNQGSKVSSSASYTFTMPADNVSYVAKFVNANKWYIKPDWWNYCSNGVDGEQATESDIGRLVDLSVNGQVHKVRLIGIDHDTLSGSIYEAHCTFEFANLLSDENGYSLSTFENNNNGTWSRNYDYLKSNLRKALEGIGEGKLTWYQKKSSTQAEIYESVYDMLPKGLCNQIKKVEKLVSLSPPDNTTDEYEAKVFALTYKEMYEKLPTGVKSEGTTYQYYKDNSNPSARIKHQVKWHKDAVSQCTSITDLPYSGRASNYAGYNSLEDAGGGIYWLVSPYSKNVELNWVINDDGNFTASNMCTIYSNALAVAPAFCV